MILFLWSANAWTLIERMKGHAFFLGYNTSTIFFNKIFFRGTGLGSIYIKNGALSAFLQPVGRRSFKSFKKIL